jgi:hypothetical protein
MPFIEEQELLQFWRFEQKLQPNSLTSNLH